MEAYAIAKVCKRYDVNFKCYKYITDYTNQESKNNWQANVSKGKPYFLDKLYQLLGY